MIRPRSWNRTPTASNSRRYQPDAMPSSKRPAASRSRLASSLASTTGLRNGSTSTPVPSLILVVRAATAASKVSESRTGKGGSTPRRIWSETEGVRKNGHRDALSGRVEPLGVEMAQYRQLVFGWRVGNRQVCLDRECKTGVLLHPVGG